MPYNEDNYWNYRLNTAPKCPLCDKVEEDWWDGHLDSNDFTTQTVTCSSCCEEYILELSLSFSTMPKDK